MKTSQFIKRTTGTALIAAVMMAASSSVFAQVKIGTSPTTIGASSNLEVQATSNNKVIVDKTTGTMKVENKPLAALTDSIVMRDATGELHQISVSRLLAQQKVPVIIFSGTLIGVHQAPKWTAPHNQLAHRVNLTPRTGFSAGWNPATKEFTLPSDGFYQVEVGLTCGGTGNQSGTLQLTRIWSSAEAAASGGAGGAQLVGTNDILTTASDQQSVVWSGEWAGGSTVSLQGMTYPRAGTLNGTYSGWCTRGYMTITKTP